MFEILEVASRADLKSDLLQELDRQRTFLDALRNNPAISRGQAEPGAGATSTARSRTCTRLSGKTGQNLRENEWLMAIKQRAGIPGGTSEFDLPSYHYWLQHPAEQRRADLADVAEAPASPVHAALSIVLRVLRESGRTVSLVAYQGVFQQTPAEKPAQMLRLSLARDLPCIPEISANKYALNIRFLLPEGVQKSRVYDQRRRLRARLLQPVTHASPARPAAGGRALLARPTAGARSARERCRLIDLGAWATESYRIPAKPDETRTTETRVRVERLTLRILRPPPLG